MMVIEIEIGLHSKKDLSRSQSQFLPSQSTSAPLSTPCLKSELSKSSKSKLLRLIHRSNVKPKCGNNTFLVSPRSCVPSFV